MLAKYFLLLQEGHQGNLQVGLLSALAPPPSPLHAAATAPALGNARDSAQEFSAHRLPRSFRELDSKFTEDRGKQGTNLPYTSGSQPFLW